MTGTSRTYQGTVTMAAGFPATMVTLTARQPQRATHTGRHRPRGGVGDRD